jgi:hypothetical protein
MRVESASERAVDIRYWGLGIGVLGYWELGIGNWELGIVIVFYLEI